MKKLFVIAILTASLAACGGKKNASSTPATRAAPRPPPTARPAVRPTARPMARRTRVRAAPTRARAASRSFVSICSGLQTNQKR